jgi:hypothetical protein
MSEIQVRNHAEIVEKVVIQGDLSKLAPAERVLYYRQVCESLGLNPLTKPFDYITLNGRLTLYTKKDATDQLRRIHGISVHIVARELIESLGLYVVTARASNVDGRQDEAVGAVSIKGLQGEAAANAIMKAETKAKRRVTLSIVGLGWTDESEVDSIPGARPVVVDPETGEILSQKTGEPAQNAQVEIVEATPQPEQPPQTSTKPDKTKPSGAVVALARSMDDCGLNEKQRDLALAVLSTFFKRQIESRKTLSDDEAKLAKRFFDELHTLAQAKGNVNMLEFFEAYAAGVLNGDGPAELMADYIALQQVQ